MAVITEALQKMAVITEAIEHDRVTFLTLPGWADTILQW